MILVLGLIWMEYNYIAEPAVWMEVKWMSAKNLQLAYSLTIALTV